MRTRPNSYRDTSFFIRRGVLSPTRLALISLIVFGLAFALGYTATAKAPNMVKSMLPGSLVQSPLIEPVPIHPILPLLHLTAAIEPVVYTDRPNYFPGETALITGSGFSPGEVVTLQVRHADDTAEGGAGHEPWSVVADSFGNFTTSWFVDPDDSAGSTFLLTATGNSSGLVAETTFTDGSANLDGCANGDFGAPELCTGANWENGNLNAGKSHYFEGDSVPYRTIFENLTAGNTYTITIEYDTTQGGDHAFDYLTSFDRTEPTPGNDPCTRKVGGSVVTICDPLTSVTTPIPIDPNVTAGQDGNLGTPGDNITQIPGVFTLFNGNALSVLNPGSAYTLSGTYAGNSSTSLKVQFTATSNIAVLAWGAHISTRLDWGTANSAIAINGSPYHIRLTQIVCSGAGEQCNVGNQDHQLAAGAVFFPIQLTIIKETNPDDAQVKQFNYTTTGSNLGPFSLTPPNGITPAQTQFNLLDTTQRTVTESDPHAAAPQFNLTGLSCSQTDGGLGVGSLSTDTGTRTVTFTPKEGQFISCTFTNAEDLEATRGRIIVDKVTVPTDATLFTFTPSYNGGGTFQLADATTPNNSGLLMPGTYTVTETANTDYSTTATCTSSLGDPADDPTSAIHLAAGETVTCTFTNTKKPKLTVTKILVPSNDTGKFNLQIDGVTEASDVGDGGSTGAKVVSIGAHTVGETAGTGTSLGDYTTVIGGDCDASGNVTLAAGANKTCTITNTRRPKLTVTKILVPSNDTGKFNLQIDGVTEASDVGDGGSTGAKFVTVGSHTVAETAGTGTSLGDYTTVIGGDCDASGNVSLAAGANKTCTITNTRKPKLTVTKILVPSNDTGKFNLQIDGVTQASDVGDGGSTGAKVVSIGSHTAGETAGTGTSLGNYTTVIGGDCDAAGNVSLAAGDNKTCTITNTRKPKLTVTKILVPSNDTGKFNLQIDGVTQATDVGDGGSTGAKFVTIGAHTVGEAAGTGTTLGNYTTVIGGDCDAAGNVSLAAGDNKTCTITNTRKPKLTVTKILVPSNDTGKFNLQIDGVTEASDVGNNGTTGAKFVTVGAHTVGETAGTGTSVGDYTTVIGGDCDAAGNVSLAAGDNKSCTITNTRKPKLTVTKILVPSNDTGKFNLQIDGVTEAANVGNNGSTGAKFVTIGAHTVAETAGTATSLANYVSVIGGDCDAAGNVSLAAGDNKTCTITNTRRGTIIVEKQTNPDGAAGSFTFTGDVAGSVSDGGQLTLNNVAPGSYKSIESDPTPGFDLTSISCDDGASATPSTTNLGTRTAYFKVDPGETVKCTFTNTKRGTIIVEKQTNPDAAAGNFTFTGTAAGSIGDGGQITVNNLVPGTYYSTEADPTPNFDLTSIVCNDANSTGDLTTRKATFRLEAGETVKCTFTNRKRGAAQVVKTFNGGALGANSFTFQLRSGASPAAAGTILETGIANSGNGGTINFATKLVPGTTYQMCEQMQPGWLTTLGPPLYSVFNPSGDNSVVCTDFTVNAGETKVFTINNQPPPGGMGLTIGFWKNWASCANSNGGQKPTLDRTVNLKTLDYGDLVLTDTNSNPDVANICTQLVSLLNKSTLTGKKMASDPIFNMVAQLVASDLNVLAGAGQSVTVMQLRDCAHALLDAIHFNGNSYNKLTAAQINLANCLAVQLDRYNNNLSVGPCAGCGP